jgi:hypothetical protein
LTPEGREQKNVSTELKVISTFPVDVRCVVAAVEVHLVDVNVKTEI